MFINYVLFLFRCLCSCLCVVCLCMMQIRQMIRQKETLVAFLCLLLLMGSHVRALASQNNSSVKGKNVIISHFSLKCFFFQGTKKFNNMLILAESKQSILNSCCDQSVCRNAVAVCFFLNAELINDMCALLFLIFIMNALLYCH